MNLAYPASGIHHASAEARPCVTQLQLNRGNHLRLHAAQDLHLGVARGVAWITVDAESGETLVRPGERFVVASGKTALVGPLRESVTLDLCVASAACASRASRSALAPLRRLLRVGHGLRVSRLQLGPAEGRRT